MLNSPVKRFMLPFSSEKSTEPLAYEVELAVIYSLAEFERQKGGGLILKQPEEKLYFISEIGYPLWLFPNSLFAYIFDGLGNFGYKIPYLELPSAKSFTENFEANSKTNEDYMTFLSSNSRYFLQPAKDKEFLIKNLFNNLDFIREFDAFRKEATEILGPNAKIATLTPNLKESEISSIIAEINRLQLSLKENAEGFRDALRLINKTTSQYVTDLDFAVEAIKDEANAKIKAQEELINPKIVKLNNDYKREITKVTTSFNDEIEKLEKLKTKTLKLNEAVEKKLIQYEKDARKQAQQNHLIYEKRLKLRSKDVKKEISGLKKELKRLENSIKSLNKQKTEKISELWLGLETEIKFTRQPLLDLEVARDAKMLVFREEAEKLIQLQKPLLDGLNNTIKLAEGVYDGFQILGIMNLQLKAPALFYVPFYVACYQVGSENRYLFFAPSTTISAGFAAKLKGVIGISKIKEMYTPRYKAVTGLIEKIHVLSKQDSFLDRQIIELGIRNNLMKNELTRVNIAKGLVYLKDAGWLSTREYQSLTNSLAQS
jgi:hypothetical protein